MTIAPDITITKQEIPKGKVADVLAVYRKYFYLPDAGHIEIIYGAVAANRGPGDPVWPLLIAPPSTGKTEPLNSIIGLGDTYPVAVLTEASLLSGTPRKDRAKESKGGLLAEMGEFGILVIKDFSGMLSLQKDSRGPILAALREVYDGSWTRYVGVEGGRKLEWRGKCGLIGAATPSMDQHYGIMSSLGERFIFYRIPDCEDEESRAGKALDFAGREKEIRKELCEATKQLFDTISISQGVPEYTQEERKRLIALATFSTRCRSVVERENYQSREVQLIPGAENPTRLVKVLSMLFRGLLDIGDTRERAWQLIGKVALDSMPAL